MFEILTVKYTKEEERILTVIGVSGISLGTLTGILISYLPGFFVDAKLAATSSIGWTAFILKIGFVIVTLSCAIAFTICVLLYTRKNMAQPNQKIWRLLLGTLFFPLITAYSFLINGLIIFPLCFFLLEYINRPLLVMMVGVLALLPFLIIIVAILVPSSPAGKTLRRSITSLKKRGKKKRNHERL